nr:hypothetical protein CFP56_21135 [Quercus suber]
MNQCSEGKKQTYICKGTILAWHQTLQHALHVDQVASDALPTLVPHRDHEQRSDQCHAIVKVPLKIRQAYASRFIRPDPLLSSRIIGRLAALQSSAELFRYRPVLPDCQRQIELYCRGQFPRVGMTKMPASQTSSTKIFVQMSGAPGSGKSTLARLLGSSIGGVVIDHDVLRSSLLKLDISFDQAAQQAYLLQWAIAQDITKQGFNVIVDSTCNYPEVIDQGSTLASQQGYAYWYVECQVRNIELLDKRLQTRTPMASQRTAVDCPPAAAQGSRAGEDARALFVKWIESPCRPDNNVVVVDSTGDTEKSGNSRKRGGKKARYSLHAEGEQLYTVIWMLRQHASRHCSWILHGSLSLGTSRSQSIDIYFRVNSHCLILGRLFIAFLDATWNMDGQGKKQVTYWFPHRLREAHVKEQCLEAWKLMCTRDHSPWCIIALCTPHVPSSANYLRKLGKTGPL